MKKQRIIDKQRREIERLNTLIFEHHDVEEAHKIEWGQMCPICLKEEKRLEAEKEKTNVNKGS